MTDTVELQVSSGGGQGGLNSQFSRIFGPNSQFSMFLWPNSQFTAFSPHFQPNSQFTSFKNSNSQHIKHNVKCTISFQLSNANICMKVIDQDISVYQLHLAFYHLTISIVKLLISNSIPEYVLNPNEKNKKIKCQVDEQSLLCGRM